MDLGINFATELFMRRLNRRENPKKTKKHYHTMHRHMLATPLVEIYSVSIHINHIFEVVQNCEIYGRIRVVDKSGDTFDLFHRGKDEPECIGVDGTLSLSSPALASNGGVNAIVPSNDVTVEVLLFDKAHNDFIIAKGEFTLDRTVIDWKEEQIRKRVQGDGGFATVHYAIFPFAVVATVDVLYFSKDDDFDLLSDDDMVPDIIGGCDLDGGVGYGDGDGDGDGNGNGSDDTDDEGVEDRSDKDDDIDYGKQECGSNFANVFGTVTARNCIQFEDSSDQKDYYNASVLFRKPPEQSVQVRSGGFVKLSRSVVAVPAYSSLKIEVDLCDRDTQVPIGRTTMEFKPRDKGIYKKDIDGDNGRIRVRLEWSEAYQQLYNTRTRKLKRTDEYAISPEIGNVVLEKRPKLLSGQQSLASLCSSSMPPGIPIKLSELTPMVEVFSVVVCRNDYEPTSFYGNIIINITDLCLYYRDKNCPQHCPALGTRLELNCHGRCDLVEDFSMWVKLKDVNRSAISYGRIVWTSGNLFYDKHLIGKRLCSIIRGDIGFVAVHYAVFNDAVAAVADVKLYGNTPNRVYGTLVARYDTHDYSSSYDKENYQSVLFRKDAEEGPTLQVCGSSIPLLKSVVSVQRNSCLIFEADLYVAPVNVVDCKLPQETQSLKGILKFEACVDGSYVGQIIGQNIHIEVSVKFEQW